jgi:hypothetical protein
VPLSGAAEREEIHQRRIVMQAYRRKDGLFDVEANLVDTKPFPFLRVLHNEPLPAGEKLHDLSIRLVLDATYVVREVEVASDATPFAVCKEAQGTLSVLVGERLGRGWTRMVKERLRGAASCTHLAELLIPLATTAIQGIRGLKSDRVMELTADGRPSKLDSCYAFATTGTLVQQLWPEHHRDGKGG